MPSGMLLVFFIALLSLIRAIPSVTVLVGCQYLKKWGEWVGAHCGMILIVCVGGTTFNLGLFCCIQFTCFDTLELKDCCAVKVSLSVVDVIDF